MRYILTLDITARQIRTHDVFVLHGHERRAGLPAWPVRHGDVHIKFAGGGDAFVSADRPITVTRPDVRRILAEYLQEDDIVCDEEGNALVMLGTLDVDEDGIKAPSYDPETGKGAGVRTFARGSVVVIAAGRR